MSRKFHIIRYLCWSVSSHLRDCIGVATPVDWLEMRPLVSATNQPPLFKKWITLSNVFYLYPVENAMGHFQVDIIWLHLPEFISFPLTWFNFPIQENSLKTIALISSQKREDPRIRIGNSMICSDIWHKYHEWYFEIVIRNFPSR